jgi:uncharacterized protein (DUF2147 family)
MRSFIRLAVLALTASTAAAAQTPLEGGLWMNPHGTVAVRTGACGGKLCGWVAWADADSLADARDAGVERLVGTELLENYVPDGPGAWSGTVFVPDKGRRFSSEINQLSPDRLKIKGCILGGLICRSQVWTRIGHLPRG